MELLSIDYMFFEIIIQDLRGGKVCSNMGKCVMESLHGRIISTVLKFKNNLSRCHPYKKKKSGQVYYGFKISLSYVEWFTEGSYGR